MLDKTHIGRAHRIATELEAEGYSDVEGSAILSMALGIFIEGFEGAHRNLQPLVKAHLDIAQQSFDALRASRDASPGHG